MEHDGYARDGFTKLDRGDKATLEEAKTGVKKFWDEWKAWAKLEEAD
jgi:hypothetical protein